MTDAQPKRSTQRSREELDAHYDRLRERSDREDLIMFINACFAATRQHEFYTVGFEPLVSVDFLHRYVLANYRRLYARTLAAGINHFNQLTIIEELLNDGAPEDSQQRQEEGRLIELALQRLPANRVFALFKRLRKLRVNNRRTRAVVRRYLYWRKEPSF